MHQIIGLRNELFDRGLTAPSVADLLKNHEQILSELSDAERVNVFFTVFHAKPGPEPRVFESQDVIPFDIDNVEESHQEEVLKLAIEAIGAEYSKVGSIRSGNGVQFFIPIEQSILSLDYFEAARPSYKLQCLKIKQAIKDLSGDVDPSVWSKTRIMRVPGTINRKQGKEDRKAYVIQPHMEPHGWNLWVEIPGSGGSMTKAEFSNYPTPDVSGVLEGCAFIKHCEENPNDISEAQWYGMLGIVAHLPNGKRIGHELSEGYHGYSEEETDAKIDHAKAASGPRTCANIDTLWNGCKDCPHFEKIKSPITIQGEDFVETEGTFLWKTVVTDKGEKLTPAFEDMVKYWKKKKGPVIRCEKDLWTYDKKKKVWKPTDPEHVKSFLYGFMRPKPKSMVIEEGFKRVTWDRFEEDFFDRASGFINLANGHLEVATGILHDHDKERGFRNMINYEYSETAYSPRFEKFLKELFPDDPGAIDFIQEYMGYIVSGDTPWLHKAAIFLGEGRNGKSTLNTIIERMVGGENVSHIPMNKLDDPTCLYNVRDKLVNIADENAVDSLANSDTLKNAVSGGDVLIKKFYEQPYTTKNKAKFIFNCNTMPHSKDKTIGLYRRLIILSFDQEFDEDAGTADHNIADKICEELPGILNFAIDGYKRLLKQKRFTIPNSAKENMEIFKDTQNDFDDWVEECIEYGEGFLSSSIARKSYVEHSEDIGRRDILATVAFQKKLSTYLKKKGFTAKRKSTDGKYARGFEGVRIKKERSKF